MIEEKVAQIKAEIKLRLDENNIRVTSINAYFDEGRLQRDGKNKDVIVVSIKEPRFNKRQFIIVDPESLEVLYVQTDIMRFLEPDDYFKPRTKDHYD